MKAMCTSKLDLKSVISSFKDTFKVFLNVLRECEMLRMTVTGRLVWCK